MKRIFILVCILSLFLLGCSDSHPEGWKSGDLKDYITNYNEVEDALKEVFNTSKVSIKQSDTTCSDIDTLSNFGNGEFYIISNDIEFQVVCKDHIATILHYNDGAENTYIYTATGKKDQNNNVINALSDIVNDGINSVSDIIDDISGE